MAQWIQKASEGASQKRAGLIAFSTPQQVASSGNLIRNDIMHKRISYAKGIRELVFAKNSMIANKSISKNDPRVKRIETEIAMTQRLKERFGKK